MVAGNRKIPASCGRALGRAVQTAAAIYRLAACSTYGVRSIITVGFLLGIYHRRPAHIELVCTCYVRSLENSDAIVVFYTLTTIRQVNLAKLGG